MSTADTSVVVLYEQKFTQLFELLAQQQDSRIAQTFRQGDHRGSKGAQAVKQIGIIDPEERTLRGEPITFADVPHDARWVYPTMFDRAVMFDTWDELQTAADPRSTYSQALMAGMNRKKDKVCLTAMFADAKTGETGSDTTTFPTSANANQISVTTGSSAASHLNLKKIKTGVRLLLANEVDLDMDQIYCSARAIDIDALSDEVQVTSQDFMGGGQAPVLAEGKIRRVYGVNIIHSEQHATVSTNTLLAMWAGSGMHFGTWQDVQTKITQRTDLRGQPWQVYVSAFFGAVRLQEKKVFQILSVTA